MKASFEIRQRVSTVTGTWMHVVLSTIHDHLAKEQFERYVAENPHDYFELIEWRLTKSTVAFISTHPLEDLRMTQVTQPEPPCTVELPVDMAPPVVVEFAPDADPFLFHTKEQRAVLLKFANDLLAEAAA
jgi:hypothetical protein